MAGSSASSISEKSADNGAHPGNIDLFRRSFVAPGGLSSQAAYEASLTHVTLKLECESVRETRVRDQHGCRTCHRKRMRHTSLPTPTVL